MILQISPRNHLTFPDPGLTNFPPGVANGPIFTRQIGAAPEMRMWLSLHHREWQTGPRRGHRWLGVFRSFPWGKFWSQKKTNRTGKTYTYEFNVHDNKSNNINHIQYIYIYVYIHKCVTMFNQFWDYAIEVHGTDALVGPPPASQTHGQVRVRWLREKLCEMWDALVKREPPAWSGWTMELILYMCLSSDM